MKRSNLETVAVALGLLAYAVIAPAQAPAADPKPFIGAWKGTLSISGMDIEIGINFTLDEAKKIQGTIDSISQGAFGIALGGIEIKDKTITFLITDPNVPGDPSFKGTLDEAGKRLAGEFTQSGETGAFSVEKQ